MTWANLYLEKTIHACCSQILILKIGGKTYIYTTTNDYCDGKACNFGLCINLKNILHSFIVTFSTYFIPVTYTFPCSCWSSFEQVCFGFFWIFFLFFMIFRKIWLLVLKYDNKYVLLLRAENSSLGLTVSIVPLGSTCERYEKDGPPNWINMATLRID